jgi:ornithine cyclodeaminase/alanine dehydrogenase-like protein (mu-crystallin family)
MKLIDFNTIQSLKINPDLCISWAKNILLNKNDAVLPEKISIKFNDDCFFNTMPSLIPEIRRFGVKVVSRYPVRHHNHYNMIQLPSLLADIMLYDYDDGRLLSVMDGTWITTFRTGAVAALSINLLKKKDTKSYSFIGLGNTARSTLVCINSLNKNKEINIKVLKYKNQHIDFIQRFSEYKNLKFDVYDSIDQLIGSSDVLISCITHTNTNLTDDSNYPDGILVVPIHTMGFQNCDLFFDRIYCDDIDHVKNFKYFSKFKNCEEISNVLLNKVPGRTNEKEKILVYNIGISLHDIYFASKIYDMVRNDDDDDILLQSDKIPKYWI